MPVSFRFRSSAVLDTIDLGGAPCISIRDLRARIVQEKSLRLCRDFDLVVSDAKTGEEYADDERIIPDGSSVVIRRVPCPRGATGDVLTSDTGNFNVLDNDLVNFDDFGQDLCPTFGASLAISDLEAETTNQSVNDCFGASPRNNGQPLPRSNTDLPMELKCSLCNKLFKDAVMIPCCQHSFCEKCICSTLVTNSSCPQCGSTKCHVRDLLPNVSLRQAIQHLPEAQMACNSSDKVIPTYDVPDDESGIQASNVKCPVSIRQRRPALLDSPSATGKGSNLVMPDSVCEGVAKPQLGSRIINLASVKSTKSDQKRMKQQQDGNGLQKKSTDMDRPDGVGDQVALSLTHPLKAEASLGLKKNKGLFSHDTAGVAGRLPLSNKNRKGERNCYMCGSPDHLVRDCPAAAALNPYPLHQTGNTVYSGGMAAYGQNYWNGSPLFPVRQFPYAYDASGMMPINPALIPITPFAVPPYMPTPYSGLPACGFMNMGGALMPNMGGTQYLPSQVENRERRDGGQKQRFSRDQHDRAHSSDADHYEYDHSVDHYKSSPRQSHNHRDRYDHFTNYSGDENHKTHKPTRGASPYSSLNQDAYLTDEEVASGRSADHKRSCSTSSSTGKLGHYPRSGTEMLTVRDCSKQHGSKKKRHQHKVSNSQKHSGRTQRNSDSSMDGHGKYHDTVEYPSDRERNFPHHKKLRHSHHSRAELSYANSSSHEMQCNVFDDSTRKSNDDCLSTEKQTADDRWNMAGDFNDSFVEEYLRLKHKRRR